MRTSVNCRGAALATVLVLGLLVTGCLKDESHNTVVTTSEESNGLVSRDEPKSGTEMAGSPATVPGNKGDERSGVVPPQPALPEAMRFGEPPPLASRPTNARLWNPDDVHFGSCEPTVIDTRRYPRQIYRSEPFRGEQRSTSSFRPVKKGRPAELPMGPRSRLRAGQLGGETLVQPDMFFPGISASPWNPPDPALAVGPAHVVQTVNMELAFFNKETGALEFQHRLDSSGDPGFFEEVGGDTFCFDPKCYYDPYHDRFVVLALEVYGSGSTGQAWITFAISDDADPHGIWYKYRTWAVVESADTTWWVDYPGLGFDSEGMYVTGNLFVLSGNGGFGGVLYRSFNKKPLLGGGTAEWADIRQSGNASVQVAQSFGRDEHPLFVSTSSSTQLRIQSLDAPFTNPSLSTAVVNVPSFSSPPAASNPGGALSVVGSRIMNVHFREGRLYTCHTVESSSGGSRAVARWYDVDVGDWPEGPDPALMQSGEVDLQNGYHTFFPAIYANRFGSVALVCGACSPTENPSVIATGRLAADNAGTMRVPSELIVGDSGANGRWGDYFDIAIDPVDDRAFWVVGEYRLSGSGWQCWIEQFSLEQVVPVLASKVDVGIPLAGGVTELESSDDVYLDVLSGDKQIVRLVTESASPILDPTQMWVVTETRIDGNLDDYEKSVELFNATTGLWETLRSEPIKLAQDVEFAIPVAGDPSRFVRASSGEVALRLTLRRMAHDPGAPDFEAGIDAVQIYVAE